MSNQMRNQYMPDYVSPPGETLQETLDALGMTQVALAERTGKTPKTINEIVKGVAPITSETAIQFERVLGVPARFWNNREQHYREFLAQQREREQLETYVDWLEKVPVKAMQALHWIADVEDCVDLLREVLQFFGVVSPLEWQQVPLYLGVTYRQSLAFESDPVAVATWLRKGVIQAQHIVCQPYDRQRFRDTLDQVRGLTTKEPSTFQDEIVRLCADAGVAVVFTPSLPKAVTSGATHWLTSDKAILQLSLRYKSADQLWFTFFHEAGHILRHGKRDVFIEIEDGQENDKEEEADRFAADFLIPRVSWQHFAHANHHYSKTEIQAFASIIGIAPGVVVGRLQKEGLLPHSHCNDLKQRLDWDENAMRIVVKDRQMVNA
jgi:HTH-type transcriptional regulator/antitoxin HigA